jgi:glycosyltransferase involved in cell wall biosynthesis
MENKKIKILSIASDSHGIGHFRTIWPAQQIESDFNSEISIEVNFLGADFQMDYLKTFDIIHFHRQLFASYDNIDVKFKELKDAGVILIMDIDDYWQPPQTHPLYYAAIKEKIAEKITKNMKHVDWVTTTTDIFAKHIKQHNKNVFVMPNGLDMTHKMWQDEDTKKTDKVRFTWIGGSSHLNDLELLRTSMNMLHNDNSISNKFQIVMCGYDVRGSITQINPDGTQQTRKIFPHETIWNKFEEIFTDNYNPNTISEEYKNYLKRYENKPFEGGDIYESNYVRRWTLPLTRYGSHYNYADVCLAPLADNIFNEVKSELKIIEAGMKRKALIAQDYSVYQQLLKHGETGLLIKKSMNRKGWYVAMKQLIENKELREKLANNLHEFVKDRYDIKNLTKERVQFYKNLVAERKQKQAEAVTA